MTEMPGSMQLSGFALACCSPGIVFSPDLGGYPGSVQMVPPQAGGGEPHLCTFLLILSKDLTYLFFL